MNKHLKRTIIAFILTALLFSNALAQGLTAFETYDFKGNTCTEKIFADYDITIVNVWTTTCSWCLKELPYFADLKNMLPENMNLITICKDATINTIKAYQILESCNALDIVTLMATPEIDEVFLDQVYAYPTTFFLDRLGNVVGDPIIGVPTFDDDIAEVYCGCAVELWERIKDY